MKRGSFLKHVRDYAELSARFRKSYGAQADALYYSYIRRVNASDLSDVAKQNEREWATSVIEREYASQDKEYAFTPIHDNLSF